jgi:hypothetical protein
MAGGNRAQENHAAQLVKAEPRAFVRYVSSREEGRRRRGSLKDAGWLARVADISASGARLLLQHCFPTGSPLVIELQSPCRTLRRHIPATVTHTTAVQVRGHQCWLVRCTFLQKLSDSDLESLR